MAATSSAVVRLLPPPRPRLGARAPHTVARPPNATVPPPATTCYLVPLQSGGIICGLDTREKSPLSTAQFKEMRRQEQVARNEELARAVDEGLADWSDSEKNSPDIKPTASLEL
jgi:hypothetical protein